jgi:hypothetical protein
MARDQALGEVVLGRPVAPTLEGKKHVDQPPQHSKRSGIELVGLHRRISAWSQSKEWRTNQSGCSLKEVIQQVSRRLVEVCRQLEPGEVILDVDATEIEAEKQEAQRTYNHVQGYLPLVGYAKGGCAWDRSFGKATRVPVRGS